MTLPPVMEGLAVPLAPTLVMLLPLLMLMLFTGTIPLPAATQVLSKRHRTADPIMCMTTEQCTVKQRHMSWSTNSKVRHRISAQKIKDVLQDQPCMPGGIWWFCMMGTMPGMWGF